MFKLKRKLADQPANAGKATPQGTKVEARKNRKSRRPKGTLAAVGALLLASALIRVGIGAGEAFAREDSGAGENKEGQHATSEAHAQAETHAASTITDSELLPLIQSLKAREERIRKREEDMAIRMQALSVAETEIERKLTALEDAERRLRQTMALAETAAEDDLSQLTDVYANMKPKQAAALFQQMDPQFAAGFLSRMRADSAAAIMAGMDPEKAYLISVILAGRNANVPTE